MTRRGSGRTRLLETKTNQTHHQEHMSNIRHFRELKVYQNGMIWAMKVFELSRRFPPEERYSLTDQMRRSSRSVCTNIGEAWRKRRYPAAFVSKLNDAEAEAAETQVWSEIVLRSGYISESVFKELDEAYDLILSQLVRMIEAPQDWVIRPRSTP